MQSLRPSFAVAAATLLVGLAAAQVPALSPPSWPAGETATGPAPQVQYEATIAAGNGGYLVAWTDQRALIAGTQSDVDVYAMRLDGNGNPLDAISIAVAARPGWQRHPQVAWNGTDWLVAFEDQRFNGSYWAASISAARVSASGQVLDPAGIVVRAPQWSSDVLWSLTANGAEWVVASSGTSGGEAGIVGRRILASGALAAPVTLVPETYFLYFGISLCAAQGEVVLSYLGASAPVASRFSATLAPLGTSFAPPSTQLASNGSSLYVAWVNGANLVGSPLSTSGVLSFPAGLPITDTFGLGEIAPPAWDGTRWWVAWQRVQSGVQFARVDAAGAVLDPGGVLLATLAPELARNLHVAANANGGQVVWDSQSVSAHPSHEVRTRHAFDASSFGPELELSLSATSQIHPALCASPDGWMLVYESQLGETRRVLAWPLDPAGNARTSAPLELGSGFTGGAPGVAWNGSVFGVSWTDGSTVVVQRVAQDGTLVDATPIPVMSGTEASIAAVGSVFLIATTQFLSNPQFRDAYVRRFDGDTGAFLDAGRVDIGGGYAQLAKVTSMEDRWLVVYQSNWSHDSPQATNIAVIVLPDGSMPTNTGIDFGGSPAAAGKRGEALIVWRLNSLANADNDIACCRIQADGTVGPKVVVSTAAGRQLSPSASWTGSQWLLAWEDQRNQTSFFDAETDVYGARVSASGALLDPQGFPWIVSGEPVASPVLATRGATTMLAASGMRSQPPFGAYRIEVVRTLVDCGSPARFCDSLPNSTGQSARIGSSGTTSLAANDLVLSCNGLPASTTGIFLMADLPLTTTGVLGNGLLCLGGPVRRMGAVQAAGGVITQPQNLHAGAWTGVSVGDTRYLQLWYRNPAGGGAGTNGSDALEVVICP